MEVKVEQSQPDMDAFDLYDDMREEDMIECIGLMHHPKDAVVESFVSSCKCYSVRSEEGLHCCFGVSRRSDDIGIVWLLGTRQMPKIRKYFLKHSKQYVEELMEGFEYLTNVVMKTNHLSYRWLQWLGAEFNDCQLDGYQSFILRSK